MRIANVSTGAIYRARELMEKMALPKHSGAMNGARTGTIYRARIRGYSFNFSSPIPPKKREQLQRILIENGGKR